MAVDRRTRRAPAAAAAAIASSLLPLLLLLVEAASAAPTPSQAIKINGVDVNLADVEAGRARLLPGVRVTSGAAARQAALASIGSSKALLPPVPPACLTVLEAIAVPPVATTGTNTALQLTRAQDFDSAGSPVCSTPLKLTSSTAVGIESTNFIGSNTISIVDDDPNSSVGVFDRTSDAFNLQVFALPPSRRPLVAGASSAFALTATNNAANNALASYYSGTASWSFIFNGTAGVRSAAPLICTGATSAGKTLSVSFLAGKHDKHNDVPLTAALDCSGGGGVIKVTGATALKSAPLVCANKTFFGRTNTVLFAPLYPQGLLGLPVLGCVADVTALAAAACDGRTTCAITDASLAAAGFNATTCPPAAFVETGSQLTAAAYYTCVAPPPNKKDHILAALAHLPFIKHNDNKINSNNNKGRKLMLDAAAMMP